MPRFHEREDCFPCINTYVCQKKSLKHQIQILVLHSMICCFIIFSVSSQGEQGFRGPPGPPGPPSLEVEGVRPTHYVPGPQVLSQFSKKQAEIVIYISIYFFIYEKKCNLSNVDLCYLLNKFVFFIPKG